MTLDEIRQVGHGWWLVDSSTGERTGGPYLKRDQAERELAWREHAADFAYELAREDMELEQHDTWQIGESKMWDDGP